MPSDLLRHEMDVASRGFALHDVQDGDRDRLSRPPRPSASRVENQHSIDSPVGREVRVPVDDDAGMRKPAWQSGVVGELMPVEHLDPYAADVDSPHLADKPAHRGVIHVPPNGDHGSQRGEVVEDRGVADVARVQYVLDALKGVEHLGSQEAVRVGHDTYPDHARRSVRSFHHAVARFDQRLLFRRQTALASRT